MKAMARPPSLFPMPPRRKISEAREGRGAERHLKKKLPRGGVRDDLQKTTPPVSAHIHFDLLDWRGFAIRRFLRTQQFGKFSRINANKLTPRGNHQHLFEIRPPSKIERGKLNVLTKGSSICSWSTFETLSLFRDQFFRGELLSRGEGLGGGNLHVGLDTGSFPVGFGDGADGACEGHANHKMFVNAVT